MEIPDVSNELASTISELKTGTDTMFMLICALFVLFMQAGFAFLEAGAVRAKNTTNIIMKNVLDVWVAALSYWAIGYSFAYGVPGNGFIGHNFFFATNVQNNFDGVNTTLQDVGTADNYYVSWFFQFVFAATASTIVSGAMAERTEFVTYLAYCFCLTAFVYPVVSHWGWSSTGWLATGVGTGLVYKDFAGSGIVHITGGTAALVGAILLGPRIGRFDGNGKPVDIPGHTLPISALGAFILFVGFLAFNGGSNLTITNPGDGAIVSLVFVNTILGGATSACVAMLINKSLLKIRGRDNFWSLIITINGGLTGMVSMCAGCNDLYPWSAVVIGAIAGISFMTWRYLVLKMKIDDPLDAVAVHLGGGLTGVILAPIFAIHGQELDGVPVGGIIFGGHWKSFQGFGWNMVAAFAIMGWTTAWSLFLFGSMKLLGILRVKPEIETMGLDAVKHGEPAYPISSYEGFFPGPGVSTCQYHDHKQKDITELNNGQVEKPKEEVEVQIQVHENNGYATENV